MGEFIANLMVKGKVWILPAFFAAAFYVRYIADDTKTKTPKTPKTPKSDQPVETPKEADAPQSDNDLVG